MPLEMPSACAVSTNGANTMRFSTALTWAAIMRSAHPDCGLSAGLGFANAPISPRTAIRSRIYGTHSSPVRAAVNVSQNSSFGIAVSPVFGHPQAAPHSQSGADEHRRPTQSLRM